MKEVVEILEFLTEIPGTWGAVVMFSDLSFLTLWGFREDPTKFGLSYFSHNTMHLHNIRHCTFLFHFKMSYAYKCNIGVFLFIFLNFYCYSITVVCLFSPSLHPTPAEPTSTLPLGFVHVSFIVVPVIPSSHCPPHEPWLLLDCS